MSLKMPTTSMRFIGNHRISENRNPSHRISSVRVLIGFRSSDTIGFNNSSHRIGSAMPADLIASHRIGTLQGHALAVDLHPKEM